MDLNGESHLKFEGHEKLDDEGHYVEKRKRRKVSATNPADSNLGKEGPTHPERKILKPKLKHATAASKVTIDPPSSSSSTSSSSSSASEQPATPTETESDSSSHKPKRRASVMFTAVRQVVQSVRRVFTKPDSPADTTTTTTVSTASESTVVEATSEPEKKKESTNNSSKTQAEMEDEIAKELAAAAERTLKHHGHHHHHHHPPTRHASSASISIDPSSPPANQLPNESTNGDEATANEDEVPLPLEQRLDYFVSSDIIDTNFHQYLIGMTAHFGYWNNKDMMHFVLSCLKKGDIVGGGGGGSGASTPTKASG
ncbi:hypothetical protein HDV05_001750 [Chytridiales sp. JEL 0842]|nr:hypothetical protein HDV05_001750 [Chytridiales sp. JEL 0842]